MTHGWTIPDAGNSEDFADQFAALMEALDEAIVLQDISDRRPDPGHEGIWYYETDTHFLKYDTGDEWLEIKPESYTDKLQSIVTTQDDFSIERHITFLQEIDADIMGRASHTLFADYAQHADDSEALLGSIKESYIENTEDKVITAPYAYRNSVQMRKVKVNGGVITLADYG